MVCMRHVIVFLLTCSLLSCKGGDSTGPETSLAAEDKGLAAENEQDLAAFYRRNVGALVTIYREHRKSYADPLWGRVALGCFISRDGLVLTAAHVVPTTYPVTLVFQATDGSTYGIFASEVKRDRVLDLSLLAPQRPIAPARFLDLDLEYRPEPGRRVAMLTEIVQWDDSNREYYRARGILPGTVSVVLTDGFLAVNVYAVGSSGSPLIDLSTERVIGVSVQYSRSSGVSQLPMPSTGEGGALVWQPVLCVRYDYNKFRSLASSRQFFSDLPWPLSLYALQQQRSFGRASPRETRSR